MPNQNRNQNRHHAIRHAFHCLTNELSELSQLTCSYLCKPGVRDLMLLSVAHDVISGLAAPTRATEAELLQPSVVYEWALVLVGFMVSQLNRLWAIILVMEIADGVVGRRVVELRDLGEWGIEVIRVVVWMVVVMKGVMGEFLM